MFIIATSKDQTINWPVKVEVAADGGKINKFEFTGTFKLLDDDERDALAESGKQAAPSGDDTELDQAWKERAVDNILKVMIGWKNVCDENRTPIDFNRDSLLAAARGVHGLSVLRAINTALGEISTGSRVKN
jgi:hypothetical protein